MTGQNEAAATTATATKSNAKIMKFSEKTKNSRFNYLDRLFELGFDDFVIPFSDSLSIDLDKNRKIADAHITLPVDCLTGEMQTIVRQFASEQQTCTNYVMCNLLVSIGVAIGTNLLIVNEAYENHPKLFACLIGPPSAGKTPSMRPVFAPLYNIDKEDLNDFKAKYAEWAKNKETSSPMPSCAQVILKDATPEAILEVLSKNPKGILIHADEAVRFFKNIDKYNGGDFVSNMSESITGDVIKLNRKTRDVPDLIEHPFMSFVCGIQPGKLKGVFSPHLDEGFPQRFLFVFPNEEESVTPVNHVVHKRWERIIRNLHMHPQITCTFDHDAKCLLEMFNKQVREFARESEKEGFDIFSEWLLKQNYTVHRMSGILHLMENNGNNEPTVITKDTVQKAIRITIAFGYHFLKVMDTITIKKKETSMGIGEAVRTVARKFKLFEKTKKRDALSIHALASFLGVSYANLYVHLKPLLEEKQSDE